MTRWSTVLLVILTVGSTTGCNPAQRAKQAEQEVDHGSAAACVQERATIEQAVEAYVLLTPDTPVTEVGMVADGFIRAESVLMDIGPDGVVVPAPGTVCA